MTQRSGTAPNHICDSAKLIATALYLELRDKAFEPAAAVEKLGKTAGVLRDTHEYRSLKERAAAYQDGVFVSANHVARAFELDVEVILREQRDS